MSALKARTQRLERRGDRSAASDLAVTVVASVSIVLPLLFYLHEHVEMLRCGYEIQSLSQQRAALVDRQRELQAERTAAASFAQTEERAALLGLVAPEPTDVYVVTGPAGGASSVALTASMTSPLE